MKMRRILVAAIIFLGAAPVASHDADPSAKLGVWAGRWTYHAQNYETRFSHASAYDGTADCRWSPNHGFMVCDFLNRSPRHGLPLNDLAILSYDAVKKTYSRVGVFKESKPFPQNVVVDGNTWTMSAKLPYKGKTVILRDVYLFEPAGRRTTTTSVSADNGKTWTTITTFTAARVGGAN
jgi:hypothetical protein